MTDTIRLETLQNRCARLVTGALFRSPTNALLNDLGWERLETRRRIHKLLFFHRLYHNNPPLPAYITSTLTDKRQDATGLKLRNADLLSIPPTQLTSFHRSYIPSTIRQWNLLPVEIRNTKSRTDFTRLIWQRFGESQPPQSNSYGTKVGNINHTRLRIGLTTLNAHLFSIQDQTVPRPSCRCGYPHENTMHYILYCPLYNEQRSQMLNAIQTIIPNVNELPTKIKFNCILFGNDATSKEGILIAHHLQTFIQSTRRFTGYSTRKKNNNNKTREIKRTRLTADGRTNGPTDGRKPDG